MPRRARWYDHLDPVTATVPCGGVQHRITWRHGKLVLDDHDLAAERAMLALGGQSCPCMQVLRMWQDQWGMNPEMLRKTDWLRDRAYLLPPELAHIRKVAGYRNWDRSWRRSSYTTRHGTLLEADLPDLANQPLRQLAWAGVPTGRPAGAPSITIKLASHAQPAAVGGWVEDDRATLTARLGVPWLVQVWGRGAAFVGGAFVLEVVEEGWSSSLVRAARWGDVDAGTGRRRLVVGRAHLSRADDDYALNWTGEDEEVAEAVAEPPAPKSIFDMDPSELFKPRR